MKIFLFLTMICFSGGIFAQPNQYELVVDAKTGAEIQSTMYGLFFEDINRSRWWFVCRTSENRSFEFPQKLMGWNIFGNVGCVTRVGHLKEPHYVRLNYSGHAHKHTGLENEGFRGIIKKRAAIASQYGPATAASSRTKDPHRTGGQRQ